MGAVCSADRKSLGFSAFPSLALRGVSDAAGQGAAERRAESSQAGADLKEQPQFWKKEGEFFRSLEAGGTEQGFSQGS